MNQTASQTTAENVFWENRSGKLHGRFSRQRIECLLKSMHIRNRIEIGRNRSISICTDFEFLFVYLIVRMCLCCMLPEKITISHTIQINKPIYSRIHTMDKRAPRTPHTKYTRRKQHKQSSSSHYVLDVFPHTTCPPLLYTHTHTDVIESSSKQSHSEFIYTWWLCYINTTKWSAQRFSFLPMQW